MSRPVVVLVLDNEGRGIADYHNQGMPEDFLWGFINPNEPERALAAIETIEESATDPDFQKWLAGLKDLFEDDDNRSSDKF